MKSALNEKILITGGTGFVGSALIKLLVNNGRQIISTVRQESQNISINKKQKNFINVGKIGSNTDWSDTLLNINTVVHLAARVHVMQDDAEDPLAAFSEVNTFGTEHLAREAAKAGVRRFVYLSSIKVNGEETGLRARNIGLGTEEFVLSKSNVRARFSESDVPNPQDPYAVSKWEAEQILHSIAKETGMEVVVIRPPLVYGPRVKANFLNMMRWLHRGVPLPLGAINNKRSLVALGNLVDLIMTCVDHPAAANQTFLAGDGEDLSTTELLRRMGKALGKPARLLPVPERLLKAGLQAIGKNDIAQRLCSSLQVDISKAQDMLGWRPPLSVDDALKLTAEWYINRLEN